MCLKKVSYFEGGITNDLKIVTKLTLSVRYFYSDIPALVLIKIQLISGMTPYYSWSFVLVVSRKCEAF